MTNHYNEENDGCSISVNIKFPSQYIEQYLLGEISYEEAFDKTTEEIYKSIRDYLTIVGGENNEEKL